MKNLESPNILLIALSGIGNLIMQMPTIATLKRKRPSSRLTLWVAPRGTKALAASLPYVDEVIEAPYKGSISQHLALIGKLRAKQFDVGIVLSPGQLLKSALYLFLSGIPTRIGSSYPLGNNPKSNFLLTNAIDEVAELHDIEQNLRLLEPLGITAPSTSHYEIPLLPEKEAVGANILDNLHLPSDKKLIGFHMGSAPGFDWKRWPLENFIALGRQLIAQHQAHILLFGGPDEDDLKKTVAAGLGGDVSIISTDLLTTAAIMKHCTAIISNDSGLMHLAAAAGGSVIGLFGPTDEKTTGPRGFHSVIIRAPGTTPVYSTEHNYNLGSEPHLTMKAITVEMVLEKIKALHL